MRKFRTRLGALAVSGVLAMTLAACGGDDTTNGGDTDNGGGTASSTFELQGTDDLKFDKTSGTVAAGEVEIVLTNGPTVEHNVVIEELGDELVVEGGPGETVSGTVELEAGTYTYYCSIPGHRQAGMEGTLTVQ
jgi:plastocyanin